MPKNKEYWEQRQINTLLQAENSVVDYESRLIAAYETALAEIQKDIQSFYGRYSKKEGITYAEAVRRMSIDEMKMMRKQISRWEESAEQLELPDEYKRYLKTIAKRRFLTRLEGLQAEIRFEIEKLYANQEVSMTELSRQNYSAAYYTTSYNISVGFEVVPELGTLNAQRVEQAVAEAWEGENYSERIWNDKNKLTKTLQRVIPQAFSRGLSVDKLSSLVSKEMGVSQRIAQRLVRTEINHLENKAARRSMQASGIVQYQFLATLDMRTTAICRDMDGYIGDLTKAKVGVNMPPMHVNCRSTIIPYFVGDPVTKRAARDEDGNHILVPGDMTQEEWIKKYVPKEQQDKLLNFVGKYRPKD